MYAHTPVSEPVPVPLPPVAELGRPLVDEGAHALLLVGDREHRVEQAPFEVNALA